MSIRRPTRHEWFQVILIVVSSRFGLVALMCAYVTAVLTGHLPYDSFQGTAMLALAAIFWVVGDLATRGLAYALEHEAKKEPKP